VIGIFATYNCGIFSAIVALTNPKAFKNMFKPKSTWMPPTRGLSQEAKKASANILNYTHKTTVDNLEKNPNGDFLRVHDIKYNLTRAEITALRELRNNKNIIIKPADKGGAIVLMDKEKYMQVGLRQLTNPKYYREIPHT